MDASLRPSGALVAFDAASGVADRCSVGALGGVEGAATSVCYRWGSDRGARSSFALPIFRGYARRTTMRIKILFLASAISLAAALKGAPTPGFLVSKDRPVPDEYWVFAPPAMGR